MDTEGKEHFKPVLREGNIHIARMVIQEMVKEKEATHALGRSPLAEAALWIQLLHLQRRIGPSAATEGTSRQVLFALKRDRVGCGNEIAALRGAAEQQMEKINQ
ncbi:hypothetical protein EYF80_019335 [Liparis tanakae]|uniref:Uncharacterized protein n=1 Tax=Liparis tanakae TaxID=230148 RepID=A0A4Z2HXS0_9TELE|nr:hypothetical protein EYF80_019335 [Liparis tanakae]